MIRVLTTDKREILETHANIIKGFLNFAVDTVSMCIAGFPEGIHTKDDEIKAVPEVVRIGKILYEKEKVDAIIVSCAADPGVPELRESVNIPVIGAGSAAAYVALAYGKPIGVLGITDEMPDVIKEILGERVVHYAKPSRVKSTLDISEAIDEYMQLATRLKERGAEVILLACTGLSTARISEKIEKELDMVVVDPVIVSGILAYYACKGNSFPFI